jgi:hypothetical protein
MSDERPRRSARDSVRAGSVMEDGAAASAAAAPAAADDRPAAREVTPAAPRSDAPPEASRAIIADAPPATPGVSAAAEDGWGALTEAQAVVARAFEDIAIEVADIARSGIAASTDAALALLGARTLAEAVEINAGLTRRGFGAMVTGSARLSEIGVQAMTQVSRPWLTQWSAMWNAAGGTDSAKYQRSR